jgi:transposase
MEAPNPSKVEVMGAPRKYPDELRERSVRLVRDAAADGESVCGACRRIGPQLGVSPDTLRSWVRRAQIDGRERPGTTSVDAARIRQLEKENAELRRANAILRTASAFFAAELVHQ